MKHITLFVGVFALLLVGCQENAQNTNTQKITKEAPQKEFSAENLVTKEFHIEGMSCQKGCAARIDKALEKQKGIKTSEVSFESKMATVEYDKTQLDENQIITIIEGVGNGRTFKVVK
ncbi:MAG: heavy-metal-associated domain-containing protein [Capnocytophaga sp.]|nr:heavy-metal-associated domain-containing protein [Capnocytophaga sp.]